ncbi:ORF1 [Seal anellovirus 4]|uniref:Capsid protein n=1 Tax=Seal anellovirus 4 TaxID=1566011 RepID=A0A0A7TXL6_9VIRU|nr:ORF1 [Seal anellovirus 4]AJA71664.1 ORF1 [Seal anellovirus 4]
MAWYWRWRTRRWRWRPRRRFVRRRRRFYPRRANRLRYNRRWVRRRRFRRRRRRHAPFTSKVLLWNPSRIVRCKIIGWHPGLFCNQFNTIDTCYVNAIEDKQTVQGFRGGGVAFLALTLNMLYREHIFGRNFWTRSNEGFDLAQYRGTRVTFFPHYQLPYIVTWLRDFATPVDKHIQDMHPQRALFGPNHKVILPRVFGRKRKWSLYIRPPPLNERKWYSMVSWCNVVIAKIGISFINLTSPLLHQESPFPAVFCGYTMQSGSFGEPPRCMLDPEGLPKVRENPTWHVGNYNLPCCYRPLWDDGTDNYVLMNYTNKPPSVQGTYRPTGTGQEVLIWQAKNRHALLAMVLRFNRIKRNYLCKPLATWQIFWPSVMGMYWYVDQARVLEGTVDTIVPDMSITVPEELPTKTNRSWIIFTPPRGENMAKIREHIHGNNIMTWPTLPQVKTICSRIAGSAGFTIGYGEMPIKTANVPFFYKSYWRWGGSFADADTRVRNPCVELPMATGTDRLGVQIRDPATVSLANIHPWDLENGSITKPAMLRILSSILGPGSHLPGAPTADPQLPQAKEGEELPEQSSSSGDSDTPTEEEPPTSEEEQETSQVWRRKLQRMGKRLRREQQYRRRVKQRLLELSGYQHPSTQFME